MNKAEVLTRRGWSRWYADDYWVHPKTVVDPSRQDFTDYGMGVEMAFRWETEGGRPFPCCGIPALSMATHDPFR